MIRVVVADDHPVVRRGLAETLTTTPGVELVGQAASYEELWDVLGSTPCDVLLLDIRMPGGDALDALGRLSDRHGETAVVVLSTYPEDQFLVRMLQAGASGYLEKSRPPSDIQDAVQTLASGRRYVTPEGAQILARTLGPGGGARDHSLLSDREFQVLRLLAQGRSVSDIAEDLHLSVKTVSTYRTRMMEKMGFSSDAEAIRYALQNELVE